MCLRFWSGSCLRSALPRASVHARRATALPALADV